MTLSYQHRYGMPAYASSPPSEPTLFTYFIVDFPYSFFDFQTPDGTLSGKPIADVLSRSDVFVATLLVCFLLFMVLWRLLGPHWRDTLSDFFYPTPHLTDAVKAKRREGRRMLVAILFCLESALLTFIVAGQVGLTNYTAPQSLLLTIYALVFGGYIAFKQLLYHVVHGIFFRSDRNTIWRNHFSFLFFVETVVMYLLLLTTVFLHFETQWVLFAGLLALLFLKTVLLFKCFSTFFWKSHGILQLFVYFCTLEGTPALLLVASLIEITRNLTLL